MFDIIPFDDQPALQWVLGPLTLHAERKGSGLRLRAYRGPDPFAGAGELRLDAEAPDGPHFLDRWYPGLTPRGPGPMRVELRPRLADRPIITRPEMDVSLPAGAEAEVFLGSPAWFSLHVDGKELVEIPSWRLSDTWFGPDTTRGVLGYAARTRLRNAREELIASAARVATQAVIVNAESRPIELDRIALPMPVMQIYRASDGRLWSDSVRVRCTDGQDASVNVEAPTGPDGAALAKLGPARQTEGTDHILHAFSAVLRGVR